MTTTKPFCVKLFRLTEILTKLDEFWEIIGRGPLINFGNNSPCACAQVKISRIHKWSNSPHKKT